MILVNNQLDAKFFMYVYFYSLHVSGSYGPIIRGITVSVRHLVYVTLCRCPSGYAGNLTLVSLKTARPTILQINVFVEE